MKNVATARSFDVLTVAHAQDESKQFSIGRVPVVVSNADADTYVKQAEAVGVQLRVTDAPDDARSTDLKTVAVASGVADPDDSTTAAAVDLSAGVAAQTGEGAPVLSFTEADGDAVDSDTQEA